MKKLSIILPLALILCFMIGCQDKEAMAELEEFRAQAEVEEQNKVLIHGMYKHWHNRNIDALAEMHAPNAKYNHPSTGETPIPIEKALEAFQMLWEAFPDLSISVEDVIADGLEGRRKSSRIARNGRAPRRGRRIGQGRIGGGPRRPRSPCRKPRGTHRNLQVPVVPQRDLHAQLCRMSLLKLRLNIDILNAHRAGCLQTHRAPYPERRHVVPIVPMPPGPMGMPVNSMPVVSASHRNSTIIRPPARP